MTATRLREWLIRQSLHVTGSITLLELYSLLNTAHFFCSLVLLCMQKKLINASKRNVSANATLSNACYSLSNATVSGTSAATTTMTIYTSSSTCSSSSVTGGSGKRRFAKPAGGGNTVALAGRLFFGLLGCRSRKALMRMFAGALMAATFALASWGCGSSSSSSSLSSSSEDAAKGTYTLSITGTDTSSSVAASTSMMLTIE